MDNHDFKILKIKDVCKVTKGSHPSMKTNPGKFVFVVTSEKRKTADSYEFEGPAVCIPLISSTGHGHAAIHRIHYQEGKFALANILVTLKPLRENQCNAKFLYHYLGIKKNEYLVPLMQGTANVSMKKTDVEELEIKLPSFATQLKISSFLDQITAKIHELNAHHQIVNHEMSLLLNSVKNKIFNEEKFKQNSQIKLKDACHYHYGYTAKSHKDDSGVAYLRITDINQNGTLDENRVFVDISKKDHDKYKMEKGDIVIARSGATAGKNHLYDSDEDMIFASYLIRFRVKIKEIIPKYLYYVLNSPSYWIYVNQNVTITAQPNINAKKLGEFEFYIPEQDKQKKIIKELDQITAKIHELNAHHQIVNHEMSLLLNSVKNKLFQNF